MPPADDSMYVPGAVSIGGGEGLRLPVQSTNANALTDGSGNALTDGSSNTLTAS